MKYNKELLIFYDTKGVVSLQANQFNNENATQFIYFLYISAKNGFVFGLICVI